GGNGPVTLGLGHGRGGGQRQGGGQAGHDQGGGLAHGGDLVAGWMWPVSASRRANALIRIKSCPAPVRAAALAGGGQGRPARLVGPIHPAAPVAAAGA
ncbi:hypothetical protein CEJ63_23755, partial [Acinetobacter baumannii]